MKYLNYIILLSKLLLIPLVVTIFWAILLTYLGAKYKIILFSTFSMEWSGLMLIPIYIATTLFFIVVYAATRKFRKKFLTRAISLLVFAIFIFLTVSYLYNKEQILNLTYNEFEQKYLREDGE